LSLSLFSAIGCSSQAAGTGSQIAGRVVLGPTCPVQRKGETCERAYQTTLAVYTAKGHRLVKKLRAAPDGRFRVTIRPGHYVVTGAGGHGLPRPSPVDATVRAHRTTQITVRFDTGIR
jgi:hypothetical protein